MDGASGAALLAPDDKGLRPWLAPTPLHWRRRLARRGDQAAALAGAVARETGAPLATGALRRVKATPRLEGFSRRARAEALRDVIAPRRGWARRIEGARVVMIDDVLTTGATLNACAAALHAMGARRVDALVFARVVPPEDHDFE
ncbi:MAG: phosphoribosyltransferase family protein [Pseudomonadota bacterium]